jgi:hypothetical protein
MAPKQKGLDVEIIEDTTGPGCLSKPSAYTEIYRGCTIDFTGRYSWSRN